MEPSPDIAGLEAPHRAAGASFTTWLGSRVVESFGDPRAEHRAVTGGCGLFDETWRGLVAIRPRPGAAAGAAAGFLARILTSDVKALEETRGQPSCLLTPKGRMLAAFHLHRTGPDDFLLIFGEPLRPEALAAIVKYAALEDVEAVEDRGRGILSIQGPRAGEALGRAGIAPLPAEPFRREETFWNGIRLRLRRAGATPEGGFEVEVPRKALEAAWTALAVASRTAGGGPAGRAASEVLRIEAGAPGWGAEADERRFPGECGWEDAVSGSKGCYIGQEIMARIRTYGHLNRKLVALGFPPPGPAPAAGAVVRAAGKAAGELTSVAVSPRDGRILALALAAPEAWEPGTPVEAGGGAAGTVIERPPVGRK